MSIILLLVGLFLLIKAANIFVDGCSHVAKALKIPSIIVGLTIVALGTSTPEAVVSITASLKQMNDMALSNVIGSNICNLLLVLGCSGLTGTLIAKKKVMTRDYKFLMFSSVLLFAIIFSFYITNQTSGIITRTSGLLLLGFLFLYFYVLMKDALKEFDKEEEHHKIKAKDIIYIILGLIGVVIGGDLVVDNAVEIANWLNISQRVIGLTIVSIGTGLPELVTSIIASKKNEDDIAIGNVVGSNILNILFILGSSSIISPITFEISAFFDAVVMMIATIIVYIILKKDKKIEKKDSIVLLLIYILYMVYILMR